ncbi:MAG: leucine-rich repeat protein [Alistipes sp.]|nr:leucine-rich repeat protein [Alistipes sp.]
MKHNLLLTLGLAAMAFAGCTHDFDEPTPVVPAPAPEGTIAINIDGGIDQIATRANEQGFCNGDAVGIYAVNYDAETPGTMVAEGNQADNVRFIFNFDEYRWIPDYDIYYKDDDTAVDLIGYYPYTTTIDNVSAYPFEVVQKQNSDATSGAIGGYEASDFLWGKAENVTPTESRIKLMFKHRMSGVQVSLVEGDGWDDGEWVQMKKEVLVANTKRNATINLATGEVTATGDVQDTDIIPYADGGEWRAVVVPQSIASGTPLLSITVDGVPYLYKYRVDDVPTDFDYISGKLHKFTVKVSKKEQTGVEFDVISVAITAWEADNVSHQDDAREYVVVHCPVANQLERTMVDRLEMDVTAIKNLKLTGSIGKADYSFMRDKMTSLMRLNLKEVESLIDGVYQIPSSAFHNKNTLIKCVLPDKLERIGLQAFYYTSLTGTLQLPEGLKYVNGFNGTKITNVHFPSTLEEIGESAFEQCKSLMCEISLPVSLKRIGIQAFWGSVIKGNLALPEGLVYIGSRAFFSCSGLTGSLTIPSGIKVISSDAFRNCGFTGNLTLPMGLTEIQSNAFSGTKFKGELNIPSTVTTIGGSAFANTEFNGTLIFPKELISLGSSAFSGCWRLSGVVEIPENIVSIPSSLFYGCSGIEGIVLHKDVEVIEGSAFGNCFYVSSIVCEAKNPPTIASSAFSGVAKDNFTIEVPEESVKKYQFASGWSEFKRIEAHCEFSISRNLLRTLNDEHSKTFVMRAPAGEAWSVESCPEWVTVTPSSGVGKVDVTITVNEMSAGDVGTFQTGTVNSSGKVTYTTHAGRSGEVVFLLDGKDYRTRMTVEQYDYEYGDGDLITLQENSVGNGVNIVIMGDCFDAKDISEGKYLKAMQDAYTYFFDIEPYLTYKDYFNVYAVVGMSADSGMGTVNTIREARFGSQYTLNEGVSPDFETVFAGACVAPINDDVATTLIILVENSYEYSGLCYMYGDGSAVAVVPMSTDPAPYDFRGLVHHEAGGHGFGKLADEYIYHNAFIQSCTCTCCGDHTDAISRMKSYGFYSNISLTGSMQEVPWSHMIYDPQYSNVVDVYEGAYMHTRGVWRSEATSCMNNNIAYYNAISREAMVKRIMKYAGEPYSYEAFKALDHESLPSKAATRAWEWDGTNFGTSSQFDQRPPKFMGEKPVFNKNKF